MVQQANLNVFFALLLNPIKFTAKKSPDYKAAQHPTPPPNPNPSFLLGVYIHACICVQTPPRAMLRANQVGMWHTLELARVPVCLLIHMGAALIKSSGSTIHTTGCLAVSKKKKKNLLVFCQVIWQNQRGEFMWVCVNVSERQGGVIRPVKWVCLCARARGRELACRERNISSRLVLVDWTVRMV